MIEIISSLIAAIPKSVTFNIWYFVIFILAAIVFLAVILPLLISNIISKNYYKKINSIEDEQLKTRSEYYEKLIENDSELRQFKHDHKNRMIALKSYLDNNDIEAARQYIKSSDEYINTLEGYRTGSCILDALLDEKSAKAERSNTKIEFSGSIVQYSLEDVDLCIIFGNAIDNAIEACEKLQSDIPKIISVNIHQQKHVISVLISNPVAETPKIDNNMIATAKGDTVNHGFGLYSINRTVKKYNGSYELSCGEKLFTIKICLSV